MPIAVSSASSIDQEIEGLTVPTLFCSTVRAFLDEPALRWKDGPDGWAQWTWRQYATMVVRAAAGLSRLGVTRGDRVVVMMRNVAEFHVVDAALCFLGACPVSIYNSSSPDQIRYYVRHSEATVAVLEDMGFLDRFLTIRQELPTLERIVLVRDPEGRAPSDIESWEELLAVTADRFGGEDELAELDKLAAQVEPHDLCTMIYTSGTTGPPKGVMLDHANIVWTLESYLRATTYKPGWRLISYLPMAHIAERTISHYLHLCTGSVVTCCPDHSQLGAYLREVRPNYLFGTPRIWERLHAGITATIIGEADPDRKAAMLDALAVGRRMAELQLAGGGKEGELAIPAELAEAHERAEASVLSAVRAALGLDDCRLAVSSSAPLGPDVLWFFRSLGVPLVETYGMSEATGPITLIDPFQVRVGTVGRAMPSVELKLADDGEVWFRGGNAFRGYLSDPQKTAEAIDDDGWVHTGDVGRLDDDGYLTIIDRKKELIITSSGKNISPANLEMALKAFPLIGQACVVGDRRPYLCALVVLDPEVTPAWAKAHGLGRHSLAELVADPTVHAEVERYFAQANQRVSRPEAIKRFTILPHEWMPDSDELTLSMKLKRRAISAKYQAEIEAMYATA